MNKRILFLLLCLIATLSVSAVSAIDNVTEENVSGEVAIEDTSYAVTESNENTKGNFTELQEKIKNTPSGGVCDLDKDYELGSKSTIIIDKPMTLDGHNYTIGDFRWTKSHNLRINITSNNVVIKNITILNCGYHGNYEYYPGVIWTGDNGCLDNVILDGFTIVTLTGNHFNISKVFNNYVDSSPIRVQGFNATISNFNGYISIYGNNSSILNLSGCVYIYGDNATLNNINISNKQINPSQNHFISLNGNNGKIINLTYNSNCIGGSPSYFHDIYLNGINITLLNSTFSKNNVSRGFTCSIINLGGENCKIINCSFIDNVIDDYTNFITSSGNNLKIFNSIFKNNILYNGAINFGGSNNVICNSTFINNTAHNSGAAIYDKSGKSKNNTILNSHFIGNTATDNGGAIYLQGDTHYIINSTFRDNIAKDEGGAIHASNLNVISSSFNNNSANNGGAIYLYNWGGDSFIGNSSFINNSCHEGGSVYTQNQLTVNNSVFLNNKLNNSEFDCYDSNKILNFYLSSSYSYVINAVNRNVVLNNVTYWGSNGLMNSGQNENIEKYSGIPITVEFYNSKMELVNNITTTTNSQGKVSVDYKDLIQGKGFVKAYHLDDSYYGYYELNRTISLNVYVPDVVKYCGAEDRLIATVYDDDGNVINDAKVEFKINGQTYTRLTDKNGVASMALNLKSGVYNVMTTYNDTWVYSTVTINSTVEANDLVKMYQNGTQFYAKFLDSNGKALAKTKVQFNINGVFYTRDTNDDGIAKLSINLMPKKYILTAINPVTDEKIGFNILVKSLVEAESMTKYYKNESKFQAKIYNKNGSLAINKEITFNINGVLYKRTTDSNGVASMKINLRPGYYIITTMVDGLEVSNGISVLPTVLANDLDMKFQDGSKFKATILNGQGIPLANQNVTFNVNGVFYSKITDADGVASLTINLNRGEYIITSMWNDYQVGNKITIS